MGNEGITRDELKDIFGEKRARGHQAKVIHCDEQNYTLDQLVEKMKDMRETDRVGMRLEAMASGNTVLADKILAAIAIIDQNQIHAFAQAVQYGLQDDYLAQYKSWAEKATLKARIESGTYVKGLDNPEKLIEILEKSIYKDFQNQLEGNKSFQDALGNVVQSHQKPGREKD